MAKLCLTWANFCTLLLPFMRLALIETVYMGDVFLLRPSPVQVYLGNRESNGHNPTQEHQANPQAYWKSYCDHLHCLPQTPQACSQAYCKSYSVGTAYGEHAWWCGTPRDLLTCAIGVVVETGTEGGLVCTNLLILLTLSLVSKYHWRQSSYHLPEIWDDR